MKKSSKLISLKLFEIRRHFNYIYNVFLIHNEKKDGACIPYTEVGGRILRSSGTKSKKMLISKIMNGFPKRMCYFRASNFNRAKVQRKNVQNDDTLISF